MRPSFLLLYVGAVSIETLGFGSGHCNNAKAPSGVHSFNSMRMLTFFLEGLLGLGNPADLFESTFSIDLRVILHVVPDLADLADWQSPFRLDKLGLISPTIDFGEVGVEEHSLVAPGTVLLVPTIPGLKYILSIVPLVR